MQSENIFEYKPKFLNCKREFRNQLPASDQGEMIELGDDEINDAMM